MNSYPLLREVIALTGWPYIFLTSLLEQSTLKTYLEVPTLTVDAAKNIFNGD